LFIDLKLPFGNNRHNNTTLNRRTPMTVTVTITAFSIRKDGIEVEKLSGTTAQAEAAWKKEADATPAGVRVELVALHNNGSEELHGWSRKPLACEWESPEARAYFQEHP
jgi:hypothetical protein